MIKELFKYGIVTVLSYAFVLTGVWLLVEVFNTDEKIAYAFILTVSYIFVYIFNTAFVFRVEFDKMRIIKYLSYLFVFWTVNNIFYGYLIDNYEINYLIAVLINIFFFGVIKFIINKKFVFSKK